MKRIINFVLLILSLSFSSCSTDLEIENCIDLSSPFQLNLNTLNSKTGFTETKSTKLEVNSEKWEKLIEWCKTNKEGWISTPASYIGDVSVVQGDFRLILMKNLEGVVIGFTDYEGIPKQYRKRIKKRELNFLYNLN